MDWKAIAIGLCFALGGFVLVIWYGKTVEIRNSLLRIEQLLRDFNDRIPEGR
jgi:hypothetical protein